MITSENEMEGLEGGGCPGMVSGELLQPFIRFLIVALRKRQNFGC